MEATSTAREDWLAAKEDWAAKRAADKAAYDAQPRVALQKVKDAALAHRGDIPDRVAALETYVSRVVDQVLALMPEPEPAPEEEPEPEEPPPEVTPH